MWQPFLLHKYYLCVNLIDEGVEMITNGRV